MNICKKTQDRICHDHAWFTAKKHQKFQSNHVKISWLQNMLMTCI